MSEPLQFSRKSILIFAAVSVLILVGGALLKPERRAAIEKVSEQERSRLQRIVRRRSVEEIGEIIAEAAVRSSEYVVYSGLTQSSGVVYGQAGRVVAASPGKPIEGPDTLFAGDAKLSGNLIFARPDLPFVVFSLSSPRPKPPRILSSGALQLGQWLVAVWRVSGGSLAFAPGLLGGNSSAACGKTSLRAVNFGSALPNSAAGGGVFDLDGELVALLVPCEDSLVAAVPESVASYLVSIPATPSTEDLLANRFGIAIEAKDKNLVVSTVWPGYPAAQAGLLAGDVLPGETNLSAKEPEVLRISRGGRLVRIPWPYQPPPGAPGEEVKK
ncbi:MAG: serine protease [Acidobacteriota bacterium]